ncbi:hypothetical protein [Chengkuizengella axinellae]|uniref:Uncharacterized protein n=1 Tax=Chengkuizengella axinellae TaxID=3064388 RepID=A0ABT9J6E8_9BACL|nr:hypothetical protein [Chengkuizengella sp. 2205SS18-9]MDP5277210.1 hypothetical protein [Chengkuizengella sp. 2205SS18-9]
MKLICKRCEIEISKQITELQDLKLLSKNNDKDYIPEGYFLQDSGKDNSTNTSSFIIINVKDLINSKYHSNTRRLNGCCGYDGLDGVNRVCINNHEIGTEKSDCWMPHYLTLNSDLVAFI